ncbi:MAG: MBL fold metallo-hydrolase, partial [Firmicutes bacterium]|nr:MBL fold metallo-hydrolase [Bacillota bacterium]
MKLTYIGHACFKLETLSSSLVLDPYADGTVPGLKNIRETADLVLCSHEHRDHGARETVVLSGKRAEELPFSVQVIETFHDDAQGAKRGPNKIHIIKAEGLKIVHFGDLGCELTEEQLTPLLDADCILIPVGGFYTIDGHQAASIAARIGAAVTVPMHYYREGVGYDVISGPEDFLDHFVEYDEEECSIQLSGNDDQRIVLLSPLNK